MLRHGQTTTFQERLDVTERAAAKGLEQAFAPGGSELPDLFHTLPLESRKPSLTHGLCCSPFFCAPAQHSRAPSQRSTQPQQQMD